MTLEEPLGLSVLRELAVASDPALTDRPLVGFGLSTVDIDRAIERASFEDGSRWEPAARDELLGARAVIRLGSERGNHLHVVLLEPDTEGRLAASLARFGEGLAAIYLASPATSTMRPPATDARYGRRANGPLGPARLLLGGAPWGPHVVVLEP